MGKYRYFRGEEDPTFKKDNRTRQAVLTALSKTAERGNPHKPYNMLTFYAGAQQIKDRSMN